MAAAFLLAVAANGQNRDPWAEARARMVEYEVVAAGVKDARVCDAMRTVPRHEFIPAAMRRYAYFDMAVPIGEGQTISSPFIVAYMTEQLQPQPTDKVLEIGTGSGYQAAVLSGLVAKVYSIEIVELAGKTCGANAPPAGLQEHRDEDRRRLSRLAGTCPLRQDHRHLLAGERPQAAGGATQGGRPIGGSPRASATSKLSTCSRKSTTSSRPSPCSRRFSCRWWAAPRMSGSCSPTPSEPAIINGDFKNLSGDQPVGWYYLRQGRVEPSGRTPGGNCLSLRNDSPGRAALALQAVGIDGRLTREIEISLWVRGQNVQPGSLPEQPPALSIAFFNANRQQVGRQEIGPWSGSFDWMEKRLRIKVPPSARLASVEVGLGGGTGRLSVTEVTMKVIASKKPSATADAK